MRIASLLVLLALLASPVASAEKSLELFDELQALIIRVSDGLKPSVVHIEVLAKRGEQRRKGLGSGLILSKDGTIITNHHVIERAQVITVILSDKSKHDAKVVRKDPQTDLAILKIEATNLPAAKLGDSDKVRVGEWVIAIGNPYGFDRTVSFGIVSGKGRFIPELDTEVQLLNDFIQTDALIDPGSSGGPLVNLRGEVIGINSVGIGRGQGFTIPARVVKEVMTRTQIEGRIERGWLGLYLQTFSREMAEYIGLKGRDGVLVADVQPGSPAEAAGLKSGDVLLTFNGAPVEGEQDEEINRFIQSVTALAPGTRVPVEVYRDGKPQTLTVTIGTQPPVEAEEIDTDFGVSVQGITWANYLEYRLEDRTGVLVSYLTRGGPGDEAGLEVGDVIVAAEDKPVRTPEEFQALLPDLNKRTRFLLKIRRGRVYRYALIDQTNYREPRKDKPESGG